MSDSCREYLDTDHLKEAHLADIMQSTLLFLDNRLSLILEGITSSQLQQWVLQQATKQHMLLSQQPSLLPANFHFHLFAAQQRLQVGPVTAPK